MRKKIVAILLIATMAMGIAACGGSGDKKDDNTITVWCWDKTFNIFAMEEAAKNGQLHAFRHEGFWQCMDTLRDKNYLDELWHSNKAPWKVW